MSSNAQKTPPRPAVNGKYDEVFKVEIDCWCYGLNKFPGEMTGALVHRVIREMQPIFRGAVDNNFVFDLLYTARLIAVAVNDILSEKEIVFSILAQLPGPHELTEDGQFVLAQIVDQAEQEYGGVLDRLERRWRGERESKSAPRAHTTIVPKVLPLVDTTAADGVDVSKKAT